MFNKIKNLIIVLCVVLLITSTLIGNYYRNKSTTLETTLAISQTTLKIERDKEKLTDNMVWINKILDKNNGLVLQLEDIEKNKPKRKKYEKRLADVNTVKEVCAEFDNLGYSICNDITLYCR